MIKGWLPSAHTSIHPSFNSLCASSSSFLRVPDFMLLATLKPYLALVFPEKTKDIRDMRFAENDAYPRFSDTRREEDAGDLAVDACFADNPADKDIFADKG